MRVLYILIRYPTLSQTYVHSELAALPSHYDVRVLTLREESIENLNYFERHFPYEVVAPRSDEDDLSFLAHVAPNEERISQIIAEFRPDMLHSHCTVMLPLLARLAQRHDLPYTLRAHSFDTLYTDFHKQALAQVRSLATPVADHCAGLLALPFSRGAIQEMGFPSEKIIDCHPVVNVKPFLDRSPNLDRVMNCGVVLDKHGQRTFIDLARRCGTNNFDLYALGEGATKLAEYNASLGSPVTVFPPKQPHEMPREYKRHRWLVSTADVHTASTGWSVSIAEAQASGVGVCIPNFRPDLRDFIGEAGYLYESLDEVVDIISRPYPEDKRQLGFEIARRSDIENHISLLTDLWDKV
jgi:Glycosyl transferase 4-like domain